MNTATDTLPEIDKPASTRPDLPRAHRTLNVPFLVVSVVLFALLAGMLYGAREWQVGRTAVALLVRADQLEKEGQWLDAAENIQRYLQLVPSADQERVRLATTYEKGIPALSLREQPARRQRAIALFYRAIGVVEDEEQPPLRRKAAQLLLQNRRYAEARTEVEKLLAQVPGDPDGLELRAKALWGQWQTKELAREGSNRESKTLAESGTNIVIVALEDAVEAKQDDIELAVALAEAYRDPDLKAFAKEDRDRNSGANVQQRTEPQRTAAADQCLAALVENRPDDFQSYLARHYFRARWNLPGADDDIAKALQLAPADIDVLLAAAKAARQESQRLRESNAVQKDITHQLELARQNYQKCSDVIKEALEEDPEDRGAKQRQGVVLLGLGEVLSALGERDQAILLWEKWLEKHSSEPIAVDVQTRLASIRLDDGDLDKAKSALDQIDSAVKNLPSSVPHETTVALQLDQDLRRGLLHIKRGEPKEAIRFLQRALLRQEQLGGVSQQSYRALLMMGGAFGELGEWKQAADAYDRATLQDPKQQVAYIAACNAWLAANEIDSASERAEQAVRLESTCRGWFTLANVLFRQQLLLAPGDRVWSRLDQAASSAQQRANDATLPDPWRIDLLLADCALAREDGLQSAGERQAEALTLLRQAEAKYPATSALLEALPLLYQRLGASADADRCCEQLAKLEGGASKATLLEVRLLTLRGDHKAAEQALLKATQSPAGIDAGVAQRELLNIKLAQKDLVGGRQLLEEAVKQSPKDLSALRRLADIDFDSRKLEAVKGWEAGMEQCGPAGQALALYFKIRRKLLEAKSPKDPVFLTALDDHAQLLRLHPHWAEAVALGGLMQESQGHAEQAIQAYEQAIALGEQRITIFERLIALLESSNRSADAEKYLARLHSSVSLSQDLTVFESTLELRRNQIDEAIEVARNGVQKRPQDASAHVWLGRMLLQNKLDSEAEASFRQAVKLQPDDVRNWNALFDFCLRTGKTDEARNILGEIASQARLKPADLNFVLAQGHEVLGDREQAAAAYDKAVAAEPKNPTILLRVAGFYRTTNIDRSVELARLAHQNAPALPLARQTLAALLSDRGRDEDWNEVDTLLSDPSADAALAVQDNRFRAILLSRKGGAKNLERAVEILEELKSQKDEDRILLAQLYERQSRLLETPDAAREMLEKSYQEFARLADQESAQPPHVIALIEFSLRHQWVSDAERGLAKLAKLLDPASKPAPQLLAQFVRLSLQQGNTEQADQYLKILEEQQPDALSCIMLRTRLMEKQGKSDEVEGFIEAAANRLLAKVSRPDEKAAVCQGIGDLYASLKRTPLAEKWFEQLLAVAPGRFDRLVMALAEQGKIAAALKVCREQSEAKNTVPAAILAVNVLASGKANDAETKEAEVLIDVARKDQPDNLQLLSAVATLRVIQGQSDAAESLFAEMVEKNGRDPLALNNLATLLAEKDGKRDQALKLIDQALLVAGREPSLLDTKGTILLFMGNAAAAAANLEAAAREPNADPRYRFHLALAYRDLKRTADAKSELERALARDLENQILTTNERKLLGELRSQLSL
jgi:Flp pilus assembly protein TadD